MEEPTGSPEPAEEARPRLDEGGSFLGCLAAALPTLVGAYERLCRVIASPDVHNVGFFLSTYFCGPVGLYIWESARGGILRRLAVGLLAWLVLALGVLLFFAGFGWVLALLTLVPGRPVRWAVRVAGLARTRPAPEMPRRLTFDLRALDVATLAFIAFIFLVTVANRDDLLRTDFVTDSDPVYHMAVARQVVELRRVPRWDRWEYAPFGRPHLYPPLLHVLGAQEQYPRPHHRLARGRALPLARRRRRARRRPSRPPPDDFPPSRGRRPSPWPAESRLSSPCLSCGGASATSRSNSSPMRSSRRFTTRRSTSSWKTPT